ncbi:FhaA domain-containing protein, partial [Rubneribacter sp.]
MPNPVFLSKLKSLFGGAEGQDCIEQATIALQPDDVDAAVTEAIRRHGRVVGGVVDVPLSYEVFVSPEDYDDYFGLRKDMLRRHLADVVRRYAEDVGGMLEGEPSFSFQVDGSLEGECRVKCSYRNVARDYGTTPVYRVDPGEHLTPRPRFEADGVDDADGGACEEAPSTGGASDVVGGSGGDGESAPLEPLPASIRLGEIVHELEPGIVVGVLGGRARAPPPDLGMGTGEKKSARK